MLTKTEAEPKIRCSTCMARVPLRASVRLEGLSRVFNCPRCRASYLVVRAGEERG